MAEKKIFRKGDRVKFVTSTYRCSPTPDPDKVYTIKDVQPLYDGVYLEELAPHLWYRADHFRLAEPTIPGVPEGYRLVRIGTPKKSELILTCDGNVIPTPYDYSGRNHVVLEKTTKTERLWIWVDKNTGEATDQWFADGAVPHPVVNISEVRTNKTREVPA